MKSEKYLIVDVGQILSEGREPLPEILAAKEHLEPGQILQLKAPFEPKPLYEIMERFGFEIKVERKGEMEWVIEFRKGENRQDHELNLDLRKLEPPMPLEKSLEAIASLERGEKLTLLTRFRPVHLFEQLDSELFDYDDEEVSEGHWRTTVWRVTL